MRSPRGGLPCQVELLLRTGSPQGRDQGTSAAQGRPDLFEDSQRVWSQAGGHVPNLSTILCMGLEVGGDSIWLVTAGI